ncbi:thioredoxin-like protein 1 [Oscarella lobularis]|uniref:thioredoxin-like protein 1 n=1 Tax=Oscarella lobularis TaxID=121494 RepID=UPI00331422E8
MDAFTSFHAFFDSSAVPHTPDRCEAYTEPAAKAKAIDFLVKATTAIALSVTQDDVDKPTDSPYIFVMSQGRVIVVASDAEFLPKMTTAGSKLVVVDFSASWCGPCKQIAPIFAQLSLKYPTAVFLKVDVDECRAVAEQYGIRAMPTFLFFKNLVKIDQLQGANAGKLEEMIKKYIGDEEEAETSGVPGHIDLGPLLAKEGCECLNESDDHPFEGALQKGGGYLESDCDEQLLIAVAFNQPVKIHSLKMYTANLQTAPKTLRIFINQPSTLDFDSAERNKAIQEITLAPEHLSGSKLISLNYVRFQNVNNITIFVKDNQGGEEVTRINYIAFIGSPLDAVKMNEFKRVAGKAGEGESLH